MPSLLVWARCTYDGYPIQINDITGYCLWVMRSFGLVLAYDPDKFSGATFWAQVLLTSGSLFGLAWFGLVLAVLVRRIYR